jgi:hypothetical protein
VIEQFSRSGNRIEGDVVQRAPTTAIAHYVVTLAADGTVQTVEYGARRPDGSPLPNAARSVTTEYGADTVTRRVMRDTMIVQKVAAKGAYPLLGNVFSMYEIWLSKLRATKADSGTATVVGVAGGGATTYAVKFFGGDSARLTTGVYSQYVYFDRSGHVQRVDGRETTLKVIATRQPSVDVKAIASAFAAAEAAGRSFGTVASPRDTARATVGTASIWVDYGRPAARGRDVWQNGVLGDTIWRTGANAATQLNTSADLVVNGVTIPAGKYTLWTHTRSAGGYQLIVNKQVGQWGTEYRPEQDLTRAPADAPPTPEPVERFTISVEPQGSNGVFRLAWGKQQLTVPFTVK